MKLNPDCIRDILMQCESVITFNKSYYYAQNTSSSLLEKYSHDEIVYHIKQAKDAGLISTGPFYDAGKSVHITDITPAGHEFLANIRTETVWNGLRSMGVRSLPILVDMAKELALSHFKSLL